MPWHDLGIMVVGKSASDIALHFIELWNHVMTDFTANYFRDKNLLKLNEEAVKRSFISNDSILSSADGA
jgi:phosphatidylserine/phosphatidylglycerophosphate/cardiolipin synthase-like enzyme